MSFDVDFDSAFKFEFEFDFDFDYDFDFECTFDFEFDFGFDRTRLDRYDDCRKSIILGSRAVLKYVKFTTVSLRRLLCFHGRSVDSLSLHGGSEDSRTLSLLRTLLCSSSSLDS